MELKTKIVNSIDINTNALSVKDLKQEAIDTIINASYGLLKPNQVNIVNIDLTFPNEPTINFQAPDGYGDAIEQAFFDGRTTVIPSDFSE